jgi:hypothetical protein
MGIEPEIGIIERYLIGENYTRSPEAGSLHLHTAIVALRVRVAAARNGNGS